MAAFPFVYHGVGTNLLKFMSILNYGILSISAAKERGIPVLKSHVSATGGDRLISLALPNSESFENYIRHGISFEIVSDGLDLVTERRGQLSGEIYARNMIPISHIRRILLNKSLLTQPIKSLDICHLTYGSASNADKINYLLKNASESEREEIIHCLDSANIAVLDLADRYRAQQISPIGNEEFLAQKAELYRLCYEMCQSQMIRQISEHLKVDVGDMTLLEFVKLCLRVSGLEGSIGLVRI